MAEKRKQTSRASGGKPAAKIVRSAAGASKPVAKKKAVVRKVARSPVAKRTVVKKAAGKKTIGKNTVGKKTAAAGPVKRVARKPAPVVRAAKKPVPAVPVKSVSSNALSVVESALDDLKAVNVRVLDVRKLTDVADIMVIASGTSDRHVRSIAERVIADAKKAGFRPSGVEGQRDSEWVLVDLQDVIVHIMLPRVREFYRLENLWDVSAARREAAELASQR